MTTQTIIASNLLERINGFVLDDPDAASPFSARLARENGWTRGFALRVIEEYRRFLYLAMTAGHPVTPSDQVDQAWHLHLTYTRSYEELCNVVLGRKLHHGPTQGGRQEQDKYHDWYQRTLDSYERHFHEEPPAEVWPEPAARFGQDLHFRRVNTRRNWVIPKPAFLSRDRSGSFTAAGAPLVLGVTTLNPFNLQGPAFLTLFGCLFAAALALSIHLRRKRPGRSARADSVDLTAEQVAYLEGGATRAVDTAVARLLRSGAIKLERLGSKRNRRYVFAPAAKVTAGRTTALEKEVLRGFQIQDRVKLPALRQHAAAAAERIRDTLVAKGLLDDAPDAWRARWQPLMLMGAVAGLGFIKILVGVGRDRPVGYLVLGCFLAAAAGLLMMFRCDRTNLGDRVRARLAAKHAGLRARLRAGSAMATPASDVALAAAMFGGAALVGGDLHDMGEAMAAHRTLAGHTAGGGCGAVAGCSTGGCGGGGCGGGGCGGCGG